MSKKLKLSPWHGCDSKPMINGLYQRKLFGGIFYCWFNSGQWYCYGTDAIDAVKEFRNRNISERLTEWRGVLK